MSSPIRKPPADVTRVIFRRWRDGDREPLALFPDLPADRFGDVLSYQHLGQHSAADYAGCIRGTRPVDLLDPDVAALKAELERIGYNLRAVRRR